MNQEERNRIVEAGLKKMGVKKHDPSDVEQLITRGRQCLKNVHGYAQLIDQEVRAAGKDHNRKILFQELSSKYLDQFCHFDREEMLILLSTFMTEITIKEIV